MKYILASASPRRLELLRQMGINPEVHKSFFEESAQQKDPKVLVKENAKGKAREVAQNFSAKDVVIGADTVVVLGKQVLGKPKDKKEAEEMLSALSGKTHEVLTGVCVVYDGKEEVIVESTLVKFRTLTKKEIEDYVKTAEPLDKAGAYGIQGRGAILVEGITGCYNNVVGLPLTRVYELFQNLGIIF